MAAMRLLTSVLRRGGRQGLMLGLMALALPGCSSPTLQRILNPFYEPPTEQALLGEMNDHALSGAQREDTARSALEHMASYQRARDPQPVNPVMRPAIVRLMWIPDHLNKNGDLVPAHYYYLKVLDEGWAVTDAFDLEEQLKTGGSASNVPYVINNQDYR